MKTIKQKNATGKNYNTTTNNLHEIPSGISS
jgi:hypothetical protein